MVDVSGVCPAITQGYFRMGLGIAQVARTDVVGVVQLP